VTRRRYPPDLAWRIHYAKVKARYRRLEAAGLCPICGGPREGCIQCPECRRKAAESNRRWRASLKRAA
jgi:hypothetical protein